VQLLVLHCPTGHLSAVAAGIAAGRLPADAPPSVASLRGYFREVLRHRRYGRINHVPMAAGAGEDTDPCSGSILVMARGVSRAVIDTALGQLQRLTGGYLEVRSGPAIRLDGKAAGYGGLPSPAGPQRDLALELALRAARGATNAGLPALADHAGAVAARRCYGLLARRAALLPTCAGAAPGSAAAASANGREEHLPPRAVYHCFGATHSSIAAAAVHTGMLPAGHRLHASDIQRIPGFDARASSDIGRAVFIQRDDQGQEVFAVGFDGARGILTRAYVDLLQLAPPESPPLVLANTLSHVSILVRIGGYLSRRLRLVGPGRALATEGIARSMPRLSAVVANTKAEMARLRQARLAEKDAGYA